MIIVMQPHAIDEAIADVVAHIRAQGLYEHISRGTEYTIIGAVGDERVFDVAQIERLPQVERAIRIANDWRMISREAWAEDTQISVSGRIFGTGQRQILQYVSGSLNSKISSENAGVLFDPFALSDNPYAVSGSLKTSEINKQIIENTQKIHTQNKIVALQIRDSSHIQTALNADVDMLYLGGEMAANRAVIDEIGRLTIPTIVSQSPHHTVRDWLLMAENIVLRGNQHVLLCNSGTMLLSGAMRLDVEALAQACELSHLPLLANISRLTNRTMKCEMLLALARTVGAHSAII